MTLATSVATRIFVEHMYALLARFPRSLRFGVAGLGHLIMEARHLRGIQRRAERTHVAETPAREERSQTMSDRPSGFPEGQGRVSRGFEAVREAFVENFARRHELGGACCA